MSACPIKIQRKSKVRFASDNKVYCVERLDASHAIDLFYRPEDYEKFRVAYKVYKAKYRSNLQKFDQMTSRSGKMALESPATPLSISLQPSQMHKSMSERGCARMA